MTRIRVGLVAELTWPGFLAPDACETSPAQGRHEGGPRSIVSGAAPSAWHRVTSISERTELAEMTAGRGVRPVEPVKLLGTTWDCRGPAYWARRAGLSLVYLILAVGGGALTYLLAYEEWISATSSMAVKIGLIVVLAAAAGWTGAATFRAYQRAEESPGRSVPRRTPTIFTPRPGMPGSAKMLAILVVGAAFCVPITLGGMSVTFAYSLRREFFGEHQARLRQRQHGRADPVPKGRRKQRR